MEQKGRVLKVSNTLLRGMEIMINIKALSKHLKTQSLFYNRLRTTYYKFLFSDKALIEKRYNKKMGRKLNLKEPKTFNEKLQWLKLNWHSTLAVKCSDKYEVRKYVENKVGIEILNDLYGVYESVDEICIDELPDSFVLKATHGSGWNIICKNKNELNWGAELKKMKIWLDSNYFWGTREWAYKDIKPRIVCERFIKTDDDKPLIDYKIFCFNGEPKFMFVANDRGIGTKFDFYDLDWNKIPVDQHYPTSNYCNVKPKEFGQMLKYARKLSEDFPHVRVDFYLDEESIIFGELTFYHFSGFERFEPDEYDEIFGAYLNLPDVN